MRPLIYTPSGRAGEYSNHGYAANLYSGCTHGCQYCYVPSVLHMDRETFHSKVTPAPDALARLKADMKRVGNLPEPVFLCFTCDPYCNDAPVGFTREAIKIILGSGNSVNILTKGGINGVADFDLLRGTDSKIGATLTFNSRDLSAKWEPNASCPESRVLMLYYAKNNGIETWASIEPVIDPKESLTIMYRTMQYVDTFKIGKWNHDKRANEIDWRKFIKDAVALCERYGKKYVLKEDLIKQTTVTHSGPPNPTTDQE